MLQGHSLSFEHFWYPYQLIFIKKQYKIDFGNNDVGRGVYKIAWKHQTANEHSDYFTVYLRKYDIFRKINDSSHWKSKMWNSMFLKA